MMHVLLKLTEGLCLSFLRRLPLTLGKLTFLQPTPVMPLLALSAAKEFRLLIFTFDDILGAKVKKKFIKLGQKKDVTFSVLPFEIADSFWIYRRK